MGRVISEAIDEGLKRQYLAKTEASKKLQEINDII
jgi:hypothetical protein